MNQTPNTQTRELKIALTIPTGRPNVTRVVDSFLKNAEFYGYDPGQFSVYLSIDLAYQDKRPEDFRLGEEVERRVKKIEYIFENQRRDFALRTVSESEVDPDLSKILFEGRGYSKQRNVALLRAAEDGNDYAICFDDDEVPYTPVRKKSGKVQWFYPDFFTPHIRALSSGTDVTKGIVAGYFSPIPSDFETEIPKEIRRRLGAALKLGNEVVDESSFLDLLVKQVRYATQTGLKYTGVKTPVLGNEYGKVVSTGNMAINLDSLRKGKIPIFYTPPNARGEDAIFGLQLQSVDVQEVRSYIFHDPFTLYPEATKGELPDYLDPIPLLNDTVARFSSALTGWLRYAPILIAMMTPSRQERCKRIDKMTRMLEKPTSMIAKILNLPELESSCEILRTYSNNVDDHLNELCWAQKTWRNKIAPCLESRVLVG
ncbi:MAG: hypothetical protein V1740_02270 [Candidatus Woesearchaeota archaeon]